DWRPAPVGGLLPHRLLTGTLCPRTKDTWRCRTPRLVCAPCRTVRVHGVRGSARGRVAACTPCNLDYVGTDGSCGHEFPEPACGGRQAAARRTARGRPRPQAGGACRTQETRRLTLKAMQVLLALAEAGGRVVSREQLLGRVWPDTLPTDDVLTQAVAQLRRAFGSGREAPPYIETIAKAGYRLLVPCTWIEPQPGAPAAVVHDAVRMPAAPSLAAAAVAAAPPPA